jgi:hypothetical protein
MYYYETQTGQAYWHGFQWVTQSQTTEMCNDSWEAAEGYWTQTKYQCANEVGRCQFLPAGYRKY